MTNHCGNGQGFDRGIYVVSLVDNRVTGTSQIGAVEWRPDADTPAPDIRCLGGQHEAELYRLLLGLEPAGRRSRFKQAVDDAYLANHTQLALANANWVVGAFIDENLRGVVEIWDAGPHGYAEAAFVVEQDWRRRGLGWALLRAAMQLAVDSRTHSLPRRRPALCYPLHIIGASSWWRAA
jgi:GNAT superfamily N-acetyltransferase